MVDGWRRRCADGEAAEDIAASELPSDSDDEGLLPGVYCRNCTARLIMGTTCLVRSVLLGGVNPAGHVCHAAVLALLHALCADQLMLATGTVCWHLLSGIVSTIAPPQDCGHDLSDDASLTAVDPLAAAAMASAQADRSVSGPDCTVLAWDERMALHAEGRSNPHPERPDRLRAVMARLLNSGLAGALSSDPC